MDYLDRILITQDAAQRWADWCMITVEMYAAIADFSVEDFGLERAELRNGQMVIVANAPWGTVEMELDSSEWEWRQTPPTTN
jgi:hypothetical protein